MAASNNPVDTAKEKVCEAIGANIYGRVNVFLSKAETGDMAGARKELSELMKFFPKGQ